MRALKGDPKSVPTVVIGDRFSGGGDCFIRPNNAEGILAMDACGRFGVDTLQTPMQGRRTDGIRFGLEFLPDRRDLEGRSGTGRRASL